jgi:peroxiredoxin Q/BCP
LVGSTVSDFSLKTQNGEVFNLYQNLNSPLLMVFYPKDDSRVCTSQLCEYNNELSSFNSLDIQVAAISTDSVESHNKFWNKYKFKFPILSDEEGIVCKMFDALTIFGNAKRKIVLIGTDRKIIYMDEKFSAFYLKVGKLLQVLLKMKSLDN